MAISEVLGEEHVVELAAGPIAYRVCGQGLPVVLVHGGLANADLWREVVPALRDRGAYRLISPDWPMGSHRHPMRPGADVTPPGIVRIIVDFLDELGLDRVVIVANDAGGAISQMLAAAHPERIDRLVLTSCDQHLQFPPRYLKPVRWLAATGLGDAIARSFGRRVVHGPFFWSVARRPLPAGIRASYLSPMLEDRRIRDELVRFFRGTRPRHTLAAARALKDFDRPALVLWGGSDLWFSRRGGRRLARTMPNGRFAVIPGARTFVPEDAPVELAERVAAFLDETAPAASA
ncbi:alpha/beta fold hydrolase [Nocardioides caeni]|uniref:Alpha/beta hydrolase n=1 Tax=Nocardioides caeni TaxID=574700 RepID=A0A4S8NLK0_9ACTN|nr:alpha/beta hydrolase [Nocardioides caeni]THV17748.1 alpha/beta hydrolase [Nocardioides caeni]